MKQINSKFIIYFIILFLIVQVIGLLTASYYSNLDIRLTLINDDPNDIINAIAIIVEILLVTGIILVLKRFFKSQGYLQVFEWLALMIGCIIVFDIFLPYLAAVIVSFLLLWIRGILKNNPSFKKQLLWVNNSLLAIAIAGAGSTIGLSLGIIPVLVFLILLSIYDIIAVFYTKHMITLAKMFVKQNLALTFALPTKERTYQLGGGDIVVPLIISSSFYFVLIKDYSFIKTLIPILLIWFSSIFGLLWTFWFLSNNKRNIKVMPALPPQALLIILSIVISYLFIL